MRLFWLLPFVAAVGCAHSSSVTASAGPSPPRAQPPSEASLAKPSGLACAPIKVHFALDSDQLYDSEKPLLDVTALCLRDNDKQRVTIVGNADERGPRTYNEDLARRRASTVASYLQQKGATPAQIEAVISHGADSPICRESTLACWQLNRRVAVRESCHL